VQRGAERQRIGQRFAHLLAKLPQVDALPGLTGTASASGRWNPGRRGVLAMALVACLSILGAGVWVLSARPSRLAPVSAPTSAQASIPASGQRATPVSPGGSLSSPATSAAPSAATTVVDVVGKVRHPGVYRLATGARVTDAIAAAGGVAAGVDLSRINLARKVADGEQLAIGVVGAAGPAAGSAASGDGSAVAGGRGSGVVDLNTATLAQLDGLPGVGPVLAQRIVDWRTAHGRFDSVDQLRGVTGIGTSKFADLRASVTVS
jgi:competence protein ComEA